MDNQIKISCSNIWKLYGKNPEKFLRENKNKPTTEQIKSNNYIPAVRDASIDVKTGEIIEFVDKDIEELQKKVAQKLGYKLIDHKLELYAQKIKKN